MRDCAVLRGWVEMESVRNEARGHTPFAAPPSPRPPLEEPWGGLLHQLEELPHVTTRLAPHTGHPLREERDQRPEYPAGQPAKDALQHEPSGLRNHWQPRVLKYRNDGGVPNLADSRLLPVLHERRIHLLAQGNLTLQSVTLETEFRRADDPVLLKEALQPVLGFAKGALSFPRLRFHELPLRRRLGLARLDVKLVDPAHQPLSQRERHTRPPGGYSHLDRTEGP